MYINPTKTKPVCFI